MRIVFLGTPEAAVPSLRAVLEAGHQIPLVVSQPDRPAGRSRRPRPTPVRSAALELGLEIFQPAKVRNVAFREMLSAAAPDVLVVVAYGRILTPRVLALAPHGAINVHFSLLPRYRGAAPVQWALARGERVTGVSTMKISEGLDEGDVLLQAETPVEPGEHAPALERRLARIGADLLVRTLAQAETGTLTPVPQDPARANYAPLLGRSDGRIDPALEARAIAGRVRGFDPWPGVWLRCGDRRVRLVEAWPAEDVVDVPPGTLIARSGGGLVMACGGGTCLVLERVQTQGGRVMSVRDAVNGRHVRPGDRLESAAETD